MSVVHVLLITQRVQPDHDILGFTVDWIEALSQKVDFLDVLTSYEGNHDLPDNVRVRSFGKERGFSKPRRVATFEYHCARYALDGEVDVAFAHMVPDFVTASYPWFRLAGIPHVLWYAHGNVDRSLRIAHRLVDAVVTPTEESFNIDSEKVHLVGHGIDTDKFAPGGVPKSRNQILWVGRIDPVKNVEVLVETMGELRDRNRDVSLRIVGEPHRGEAYFDSVRNRVDELGLGDRITFVGRLTQDEVVDEYRHAGVFINASETGSLDKIEIEGLACGTPVVSSNESYVGMIEDSGLDESLLTYPAGDTDALADRIERLLELSEDQYEQVCETGRDVVKSRHDVTGMMERITRVLAEVGDANS